MAENKSDPPETPLSSEALKRGEWRGDEQKLRPQDAPGHMLPASERGAAPDEGAPAGPNPMAGTMLPPD